MLNEASALASQQTREATSLTAAEAPDGDLRQHEVDVLLRHLIEDRGLTAAGVTQFTLISVFANSLPSDLVRPMTPAFDAL